MKPRNFLRISLVTALALSHQTAKAESRNQLSVQGLAAFATSTADTSARSSSARLLSIPAIRIQGRIPLEGAFRVVLNQKRSKRGTATRTLANGEKQADNTRVELLRGTIEFRRRNRQRLPIAAALIYSGTNPELSLTFKGSRRRAAQRESLYTLRGRLASSSKFMARIARVPAAAMQALSCGTDGSHAQHSSAPEERSSDGVSAAATHKVVEVSSDADSEWFSAHGSNSNAEIVAVLDAVEVIYKRDLGVDFDLVSQNVFTSSSPYSSTNASTLLGQFRSYSLTNQHLGSADLYHLFTGKEIDGSTVGIAYVGVLCSSSSFSYGLSQNYNRAILTQIVAHELGHNFNANHDTSSPDPGIMAPSVSGATAFSAFSIAEMSDHMTTYPSCLGTREDSSTPTPTPTATVGATATPTPSPTATASVEPTSSSTPPPGGSDPDPTASLDPNDPSDDLNGASLILLKTRIRGRSYLLQALFIDANGQALEGYSVTLLRSRSRDFGSGAARVGTGTTDVEGVASFVTRASGYYRVRIVADDERFMSSRVRLR
jgi:hypothetical protein